MVEDRITDGRRIAQLLASELRGREDGALGALAVADVQDAEPTPDGDFAYRVVREDETVAEVFVHPDRARVVFKTAPERVLEAAEEAGLRVRPAGGGENPKILVFVESGAAVKHATDVFASLEIPEDSR